MQVIGFLMSLIMMASSVTMTAQSKSEKATLVENAVSTLLSGMSGVFEDETGALVEAIAQNILVEAFTGESKYEDFAVLAEQIPVHEDGAPDREKEDVTAGPLRQVFGRVSAAMIENTMVSGVVKDFLLLVSDGVYEMYIYLIPAAEEGVYIFCCSYIDNYGNEIVRETKTYYDKNTGRVYGSDGRGMLGIGFDYETDSYLVTTPVYAWQRDFGFTVFYDYFGELGFMKTDTVRVKFEYAGKDWMFQFWKGNYTFGLLNGAEIGIYNKESKISPMYDCASDEEMLNMSMKVYYNDELLFEREETRHWWICGLKFGPSVPPEEILVNGTIEFEDGEMMNKFMEAAKEFEDEMIVSADGMKVNVIWQ